MTSCFVPTLLVSALACVAPLAASAQSVTIERMERERVRVEREREDRDRLEVSRGRFETRAERIEQERFNAVRDAWEVARRAEQRAGISTSWRSELWQRGVEREARQYASSERARIAAQGDRTQSTCAQPAGGTIWPYRKSTTK